MKDKNDKQLKDLDIIDIHQTVNGQNLFVVLSIAPLDIRYHHDLDRQYEYSQEDLLAPDKYTGETTYEIVGNLDGNPVGDSPNHFNK